MSKSPKLDTAIARARSANADAAPVDEVSLTTIGADQIQASIQAFDASALAALVAAGVVEAAPQLLTLTAGQMITGLVDTTGTTELEDENTRLPKTIATWQISLVDPVTLAPNGLRVSILSSAQLDRMLPPHLGTGRPVIIARGGEIAIKGGKRRMSEYFVGAYKAPA